MPDHCPTHLHVRLLLVNGATGKRVCPVCAGATAADGAEAAVEPIRPAACLHRGDRRPYRLNQGMELCASCGCVVLARGRA